MNKIWAHGAGSGLPTNAQPDYQNRGGGAKYVLPPPFSRSCNVVNGYTTNGTHASSVHAKNDHWRWRHHIVCNNANHSHNNSVTSQNTQLQNCRNLKSCILCTFLTACSVICYIITASDALTCIHCAQDIVTLRLPG